MKSLLQSCNMKVWDLYNLMSGGYDLSVTITGTSLREIALFVSERLSTLDGVLSTATHFVLRRYKDKGVVFTTHCRDERSLVSP